MERLRELQILIDNVLHVEMADDFQLQMSMTKVL